MCFWFAGAASRIPSIRSAPKIDRCTASPFSKRSADEVVDCPRKRQRHAARLQHLVRNPYEVGDLRHADVGNGLIKRLLHLDGRHSGVQRAFERRPVGGPPCEAMFEARMHSMRVRVSSWP